MAFFVRPRHRARHQERAAQEGRDAAVLLKHIAVEVVGDVAFAVIAERVKNAADLLSAGEDELVLLPHALRLAHDKKRALQQRLQAARDGGVFRIQPNLLMGERRGVQERAVGLRPRAAHALHGDPAQLVFHLG